MANTFEATGNPYLLPVNTQAVYVSKAGNDTTGNGSETNPYLTITKAMGSITDSATTKRYMIKLGNGDYSDNFALKANVIIMGDDYNYTRLTGTITLNDATWNNSNDNRSSISNVTITLANTFDFTVQSSTAGKLYLNSVTANALLTFTAYNSINQVLMDNCLFFASWTQTGIQLFAWGCAIQGGTITVNSSSLANSYCLLFATPSYGNLTASWVSPNSSVEVDLYNSFISGGVSVSGASCTLVSSLDSLPTSGNSFTNSAVVNLTSTWTTGVKVVEGSNAKQGVSTLASGTVTVSNTSVTSTSRIFLTAQDNNSLGALRVSARTAGTSFTITSSLATDSGVVAWEIFEVG